jgi:membrane-bound lytic murein transglycosylase MltF
MRRCAFVVLLLFVPVVSSAQVSDKSKYDEIFRKYTKRFFGPGFDWQYFKAQAMAESDLVPTARSRVGATGLMQLMPATYNEIKAKKPELGAIDDPEFNIAAGIMHSRGLWVSLKEHENEAERFRFMFASYNAGQGTIRRAKTVAKANQLDPTTWQSIESVAPKVQRWRYKETLPYVHKIEKNHDLLSKQPRKVNVVKPDTTKS